MKKGLSLECPIGAICFLTLHYLHCLHFQRKSTSEDRETPFASLACNLVH